MQYDKEILRVLAEAGNEGLPVQKVSCHVFNACSPLFNSLNQEDVHKYVQMCLLKNSKSCNSLIEKSRKGVYRLNENNQLSQQLILQLHDEVEAPKEKSTEDRSLNLLDFRFYSFITVVILA